MSSSENEKPSPTNVGGQAVLEGVMMCAPGAMTIVCRRFDGTIVMRERKLPNAPPAWAKLPLLRGIRTFGNSIRMGHGALKFSGEVMEEGFVDEDDQPPADTDKGKKAKKSGAKGLNMLSLQALGLQTLGFLQRASDEEPEGSGEGDGKPDKEENEQVVEVAEKSTNPILIVIPILMAIGLYVVLPQAVAEGTNSLFKLNLAVTAPLFQVLTGIAKLCIVVALMSLIRFTKEGRRMFQYHGAEHKSISTYEGSEPLIVECARKTTALHARCGTTFIIMVAFVSVVVFSTIGAFLPPISDSRLVQSVAFFFLKLPFLPVVAGITYEIQRFFAKYCSTGPLRALLWPGFLVQKITTAPPDDDQLEIALASLRSALGRAATATLPTKGHIDRRFESYAALIADPIYAEPVAALVETSTAPAPLEQGA